MMNNNKSGTKLTALAFACSLGMMSPALHAVTVEFDNVGTVEFKADAFVKGYNVDNGEGNFNTGDDVKGAQSQARLTLNLTNENGWSINTRMLGFYDWAGDRRHSGGSGSDYTSDKNIDSLSLDLAYLQYKGDDGWLFRVGRQEASWAYGFNIQDDRRDRILAMKTIMTDGGYLGLIGLYDLRFSEDFSQNSVAPLSTGDLNMYTIAAIGNQSGLDWGVLWAYFDGESAPDFPNEFPNPYFIDNFHNISPYLGKTIGDFSFKTAANFNLSDANAEQANYFWGNNSWAAFVEAGYQITPEFQIQAQVAGIGDGGQVGRGWDSYSMLINNSPRNEINPTRTEFFGGLGDFNGNTGKDGIIYGVRANWTPMDELTVTLAAGRMELDLYNADLSTVLPDFYRDNTYGNFFDIKALYEFSKGTSVELRAGHADEDIDDTAVMTTLRVSFG
ncbi:hypothetical protein Ssed_3531 [Shewanella sediminis HAW-EB3]|uniref:Alginate export domain-containing protein n=1 Tax=Shewanella sediminis (strain HAW-EB3) TaxID=425104 RepID=A8FZ62_SHESH|nr:hypothetical protein [Shewanella sediminis]ABV38135.1 hypothetical protein Ssed_3531 [Shewanella sediminis HAW-EB3]